ncbi:guanine deaminase [Vibrio sp. SS-MA-C1-2]|uniref:guanine deaminase n=1 Tax=Vibrio sp. SS-MA-C1-2 TaxID=2908646 RepID=UPI001F33F095|nr:guanine deaminase [Vibrio sp. SS-MA-C1-2]UJF17960.1 guanine deaminase [Vibrio sp. SS-MA-C1-2]
MNIKKGIVGKIFHCPIKGEFKYYENGLITIDQHGKISDILQPSDPNYSNTLSLLKKNDCLQQLTAKQYLLPGMVDLHIHAPQWPQAGKGLDLPLNEWLDHYTFPLEHKFSDRTFAEQYYPHLVKTYLANGTTTAAYFATIDTPSSLYLAETCIQLGQRALVGKVSMDDQEMCPDYYVEESAAHSIQQAENFIQALAQLPNNNHLVEPIITPRFIPTCTLEALKGLGDLAKKYQCAVQTHASESDWARDFSKEKYGKTDIEIYDQAGLLGERTILAHSIFLTDSDLETIKKKGAGIAHCPRSNIYFANAALPLREYLDQNIHLGLGSDIAGGPLPSLFMACSDAVLHSRARECGTNTKLPPEIRGEAESRVSLLEAYWMATTGGGELLKLPVGQFKAGYCFDALVIDTDVEDSNLLICPELDSPQDTLEKIITHTTRSNIRHIWVDGDKVN